MKLWLLRPIENLPKGDNPWEPWYDKYFGFVIRANSEENARKIAHDNAGDENRGEFCGDKISRTTSPWLDAAYSSCVELTTDGPEGLIIEDYAAA